MQRGTSRNLRRILTSGKLCFLDNADLINMSEHAILSEQQNNCKSTCSLPSFWLTAVVTALVFGLSRHKVAHAAGKENDPSHSARVRIQMPNLLRNKKALEETRNQKIARRVATLWMPLTLDIIVTCNSRVVGTEEVSKMKLFPNNFTTEFNTRIAASFTYI